MILDEAQVKKAVGPIMSNFDIRYAGLFGSVARGDNKDDSDVDLLIDIGHPMGMITYMKFVYELEAALHRSVDIVPYKNVQSSLREEIQKDLLTVYEKR